MRKILSLVMALVMTLALAVPAFAAGGFSDVPTSHWAYNDIMACAEQGIVKGYEDGSFHPNDNVTSAQFVAMLTRTFYSSDVAAAQGAGGAWYAPNVQAANAHGLLDFWSNYAVEVNNEPINRNLMAVVLSNIMDDFGKSASDSEKAGVENQITDWQKIGAPHRREVTNCYAKGILTGMSDGRFAGFSNMTRAQACAVIVRMMDLVGGSTPAAPVTPTQPEQPQQPAQPQQPEAPAETGTGKLANGKDATVANVQAILDNIKNKYPAGTVWDANGTNGNSYGSGTGSVDVKAIPEIGAVRLDTRLACGGWAAMVSDTIFGQSGAPARRVSKTSDLRPGDIIIVMNSSTKKMTHVGIYLGADPYSNSGYILTCDGNSGGTVTWSSSKRPLEDTSGNSYTIAYTRYPE